MSADDIKVVKNPGTVRQYQVSDRTVDPGKSTTIKFGEPVKACPDSQFVTKIANGDPELGTDEFIGIAYDTSDETSTADGTVDVITLVLGTVMRGSATDTFTAAELATYYNNNVCFDVSSDSFTIDDDETHDPNVHGLRIIAGDSNLNTLDVIVNIMTTEHAPYVE